MMHGQRNIKLSSLFSVTCWDSNTVTERILRKGWTVCANNKTY